MNKVPVKKIWLIIRIVISALLLFILFQLFDLSAIPALFRNIAGKNIIVTLLLIFLSVMVSTQKWKLLIYSQNLCVSFRELFFAYLTGHFFNNFLPSSIGGDAARVLYVGKKRGLIPEFTASVIAERILATVSLSLLGLAGSLFSVHKNFTAVIILVSVFIASAGLFVLLIIGYLPPFLRQGFGTAGQKIRDASQSIRRIRKKPFSVIASFVFSIIFQIIVALVVFSILNAFNITHISFIDIVFITSAVSVLSMIPVGINGYGLREGSYVLLLASYGVGADTAVSISILFALLVSIFSISGLFTWLLKDSINILHLPERNLL
jgi:hypothetical protein